MKPGLPLISFSVILVLLLIAAGCTQPMSVPATVPTATVTAAAVNVTTNETLVAFVNEAVLYAQTHDKETALAEFSNRNGSFVRGELYIYAYDFNSTTLAHPVSPEKIGVSRINERDALGNLYAGRFIDAVNNGSGFLWFYYINPAHNNAIEKKLGYVAKVNDDWWLGSGVYYGPLDPSVAASSGAPSTTQEIKDFVDSAAAYAQKNGKDAALAAFSNKSGPFTRGDLYIYALDYSGNALALPYQPQLTGTSFFNLKDVSGRYYTRTEIQLARDGGGYLLFQYPDPSRNYTVRYKISYVRPVDDTYWIGAGIYTTENKLVDTELRQFVADAKAYAMANGKKRALAEFNNPNGSFVKDGLYIFADDYNGTVLAWPYRTDLVGVNMFNATDAMGSYHFQAILNSARNGTGMVEYYTQNPSTNTTQLKIGYVTDVDGTWVLGAGRYMEPGTVNIRE
ncbi:cache domain-containing protein [Methanoregula sp.]|uniref:cache domain-containing protein n=1 Tax=Methanoregula sp. TaxID=2052170 RepID=UPI0023716B23|nr:cache domain-containing protein [Methanoregula sp.]MDD1686366.1 cache domain-containing protein [Methanoregula sp.]